MYTVVSKQQFSEKVFKLEITAPLIARSRKAGHFVIVRLGASARRCTVMASALSNIVTRYPSVETVWMGIGLM